MNEKEIGQFINTIHIVITLKMIRIKDEEYFIAYALCSVSKFFSDILSTVYLVGNYTLF